METINMALVADACNTIGCPSGVVSRFSSLCSASNADYQNVLKKTAKFVKLAADAFRPDSADSPRVCTSFFKLVDKQAVEFYKDEVVLPAFETFYSGASLPEQYEARKDDCLLLELELPETLAQRVATEVPAADAAGGAKHQLSLPPYSVLRLKEKTYNHIKLQAKA
uniref:Uncharacterized protein n=1 Tax=Euplotes harpa TaxID=151035 RepID=A0A7S3J3D3_9SPIT|mmetsp:Transcript_17420/g.20231  ORF Transcript_17420/g.20231 Transcript_17420/m.20231 type:complete len:167 (+) Transcript_17420:1079-1579(+)